MIPEAAIDAAAKARRDLKLNRYYATREVASVTHEGNRIFRSAQEPTEEEYARAALEAALPILLSHEREETRLAHLDAVVNAATVDELQAKLDVLLVLHEPRDVPYTRDKYCAVCKGDVGQRVKYPCPTARGLA